MNKIQKKIFFVLGGPGSGKGTFCQYFVKKNSFANHYSAGELLRNFMYQNKNTKDATNKKTYNVILSNINQGRIVPAQVTIKLLLDKIANNSKNFLLIDGFPRNQDNYKHWQKQNFKNFENYAVFLNCKQETLYQRMINRQKNAIEQRSDDNEKVFNLRLQTFENETLPIVDQYRVQNKLIELNAEQQPEDIVKDFESIYPSLFKQLNQKIFININLLFLKNKIFKKIKHKFYLKNNVINLNLFLKQKQSINQNIKEHMINDASDVHRKRFYSENLSSPMFCFLDKHKIQQPLTPQIRPLKLDEGLFDELEELDLEPSEEFEIEKAEIETYLSTNDESVLQKIKPKAFKKNEFEFSFDINKQQICQTSLKSCTQEQSQDNFLALHKNSINKQLIFFILLFVANNYYIKLFFELQNL